jgi:hypothetical protein
VGNSVHEFFYRKLTLVFIHFLTCCSSAGGKLVEPTPEIERELATELEKVAKQYGGGEGVDMTQFPTFKFKGNYGNCYWPPRPVMGITLLFSFLLYVTDYRYNLE